MSDFAIIGGTGAADLLPADGISSIEVTSCYGDPSGPILEWSVGESRCLFLPRHGPGGTIPPHCVNYRANIQALRDMGVSNIIGINAVGGICRSAKPGSLVLPDQIVDYTWGREHTFFDQTDRPVTHIEFDSPVSTQLHRRLVEQAVELKLDCLPSGVYGVTQGPRLESAAEIDRMERDGCDLVGMTAMPEAALAREAGIAYAICAVVVNYAAGRAPDGAAIHDQMKQSVQDGMKQVNRLLGAILQSSR